MSASSSAARSPRELSVLALAALGVVYGDIGTSPLYTLRECFIGHHPLELSHANVLGILSLIFWSLIVVVTLKYVTFITRADNQGEGGVLALLALTKRVPVNSRIGRHALVIAGIFGASLFLGDGMITPAISVLSAVEGLKVAAPHLPHIVIPLTIVVLIGLFAVQRKGTGHVGAMFGPIMMLWFLSLGLLGLRGILAHPQVLAALNPGYAIQFFVTHGIASLLVFGAVVLAVTGGEALYADMGHFGRRPIQLAWLLVVLPALVLNYFGQGALLLFEPAAIANPFFHLAPSALVWPLLGLSTVATIIASQAVISGVFSITRQAVLLGYWPRVLIKHTSHEEIGQIYIPAMNWLLFGAVIALVIGFQSSSNLAAAYGIAVTAAMMVDTVLACVVARGLWRWPMALVLLVGAVFLTIDSAFLFSNLLKVVDGGWFPLLVGSLFMALMLTWRSGRKVLSQSLMASTMPLERFVTLMDNDPPTPVSGTAVFLTSTPERVPHALLHNLKHNKVLHETNVILTIHTQKVPVVPMEERVLIQHLSSRFFLVDAYYGFQENPDICEILRDCARDGLEFDPASTSFFLSRERLIPSEHPGLPPVIDTLFAFMSRNATSVTDFFNIPTNRVVELGTQIEI